MIRNSGLSLEEIHARCGLQPATLRSWEDKEVSRPQLAKL
jgi:hypothetical protein